MRLLLDGRVDEVGDAYDNDELQRVFGRPAATILIATQSTWRDWLLGRMADKLDAAKQQVDRMRSIHGAVVMLAWRYAEVGDRDAARREFASVSSLGLETIFRKEIGGYSFAQPTMLCTQLDDAASAAVLYRLLRERRQTLAYSQWGVCYGAVAHYLGMLATTAGMHAQAHAHFGEARVLHAALRSEPLVAFTEIEHARLLHARNGLNDAELANRLTVAALGRVERLRLAGLEQRARDLMTSSAEQQV